MSELKATTTLLLLLGCLPLVSACHTAPQLDLKAANKDTFSHGMVNYLAAHGELCLDKEFPLDVTEREFALRARNAVQMPALEHLGLVTSSAAMGQITGEDGPVAVPVTRFELTETGRGYYRTQPGAAEGQKAHGDLCVAKLSLDHVLSWELSAPQGATAAVVKYTYRVEAAPWTRTPEIQAVFPAVDRVIRGAGTAPLEEHFTLTGEGWVANELLAADARALARNGAR